MPKTLKLTVTAAAVATGLLAATGLYAQESGRQEMPGGMMGEGTPRGGMMGQGMMPMMEQMNQMMQTCNNMMQSMMDEQPPTGPAQREKPMPRGPEESAPQPGNQG
jgi:hypothetical protein